MFKKSRNKTKVTEVTNIKQERRFFNKKSKPAPAIEETPKKKGFLEDPRVPTAIGIVTGTAVAVGSVCTTVHQVRTLCKPDKEPIEETTCRLILAWLLDNPLLNEKTPNTEISRLTLESMYLKRANHAVRTRTCQMVVARWPEYYLTYGNYGKFDVNTK